MLGGDFIMGFLDWFGLITAVIDVVGVIILYFVFKNTQDVAPFLDSLITVSSIVAELMLCWKLYESWVIYLLTKNKKTQAPSIVLIIMK